MKNRNLKLIILIIFLLHFNSYATLLKATISEDYIPKGFFGSWGVISKLNSTNNPQIFNSESRDIWTLSGFNNILILENKESGAISQIKIENKNKDNKTLKFKRAKEINKNGDKIIYKETITFILNNDNFSGFDEYIIEEYKNNKIIKKNIANYQIEGIRIPE